MRRGFLLFILALWFVIGCQKQAKPPAIGTQYLNISFHSEIQSLDPRKGIDYPTCFLLKMLFEGLTHIGLTGAVEPGLANHWTLSEDQKTYTFFLRSSCWSNGDPLTAYDFEYSWKRVLNPADPSLGAPSLFPIKNAQAIFLNQKPLDSLGVKILDATTIQVELEYPTPYFLELLGTPPFFPINHKVDLTDKDWLQKTGSHFICNGPFTLEHYRHIDEIVVVKNPSYWDADSVKLPGIRIAIVKDMNTQLQLFEKNELHWLGNPISKFPIDALEHMKKTEQLKRNNTLGVYWYFINVESFPFQNKKMRQAFAYAIERKQICNTLLDRTSLPAMSVLAHSLATQKRPFFDQTDPELAKMLFEEALEEMGITRDDLPVITLNFSVSDPEYVRVAEATQEQWQQTFGIPIHLEQLDWRSHYSKLQNGNFQIGGMGWNSWTRDPMYMLQTFLKKDLGVNMSRWENGEYQRLLMQAQQEGNLTKRRRYYNQAEAVLMDEMPVIPVYFITSKYAQSPHLKNVYLSDLYEVDFRWAYLEE